MKYQVLKDGIKVDKQDFNPQHILECGQVFCYEKKGENYIVYPQNKYAEIEEEENYYHIKTKNAQFFVDYFDLSTNYSKIKKDLSLNKMLLKPLEFGYGIRILNQDLFETLISFIISANNNIKRIKLILSRLRERLGEKIRAEVYTFPNYEKMKEMPEEFFKEIGAGYRAPYLYKVLRQITPQQLEDWKNLDTQSLKRKLIELSGVGPKVADCILLFGYHRGESFPVDTWIAKMYNHHFEQIENRKIMAKNLVDMFGKNAGYAQQYLFYYTRENGEKVLN